MEETTEQKEIAVEEINENEGRRLERAEQNEIIKSYVLFFFHQTKYKQHIWATVNGRHARNRVREIYCHVPTFIYC
jgi:hypothetical protein